MPAIPMPPRIAVVSPDNRFLRWEARHAIHEQRLPHRSVHVMIFDSAGRMLLQRRHPQKQTYPNYWDTAVAGHVEDGDYHAGPDDELDLVYERVALRELEEELGVQTELRLLGRFSPAEGVHYEHFQLYSGVSDGPFTLQPEEVVDSRWVTPDELDQLAASGQPLTHLVVYLTQWLRERGLWGAQKP
jgi:isopentenyldiphosphate isomerase